MSAGKPPPEPDDPPLFRVFNEVGIIAQLSQTAFERAMPRGMTMAQFTVLNLLVRRPGERGPAELASAFQVSRATMTTTLRRLAAKGLVAIAADPEDGRAKRVALTPSGRAMREACIAATAPGLARLLRRFPERAARALLPGLGRLRAALDADRDEAPRPAAPQNG